MTRVDVRVGPVRFHGWRAFVYWLGAWLLYVLGRVLVWSVCRPRTTGALLASAALLWALYQRPVTTLLLSWLLAEVGHWWALLGPASWRHTRLPARWRSVWLYRRKWRTAMQVAELDRRDRDGRLQVPRLGWVRCTPTTDLIRVRALLGQRFSDYETAAPMLAHVFGATGYALHRGDDRRLTLELVRGEVGRSWNREGYELGADL